MRSLWTLAVSALLCSGPWIESEPKKKSVPARLCNLWWGVVFILSDVALPVSFFPTETEEVKTQSRSCPSSWTRYGSLCFMFVSTQRTWLEAEVHRYYKTCLPLRKIPLSTLYWVKKIYSFVTNSLVGTDSLSPPIVILRALWGKPCVCTQFSRASLCARVGETTYELFNLSLDRRIWPCSGTVPMHYATPSYTVCLGILSTEPHTQIVQMMYNTFDTLVVIHLTFLWYNIEFVCTEIITQPLSGVFTKLV